MHDLPATRLRYLIHGHGVELVCSLPALLDPLQQALGQFEDRAQRPATARPVAGVVGPYRQDQVLRHLSPTATRVACDAEATSELYEEAERFWLIDDHWGLCQINILKGQFRGWIVCEPAIDAAAAVERAVMWPIAQLLRARGLWLVPSAAVVRDGWGALLISTFSIEPEFTALVRAGYRIVGQNWTALREQEGRTQMLAMPGYVHRLLRRGPTAPGVWQQAARHRVDLTAEFCGCGCPEALCDAVILICPGRRPLPHLEPISPPNALSAVRRAWPIVELHPQRRPGLMPARLAQRCAVFSMQLSRDPRHVLDLLEAARTRRPSRPSVWIHAPNIRRPVVA